MSSQFSYELDERQIRLTMQDAEMDYNEAIWNKFESLAPIESKSSKLIGSLIPSINMGISRSVIVPILFVVLIGGLSAMLFSFVDFKKKAAIDKEIPLIANPNNVIKQVSTSEKVSKPILKTQIAKVIADTTIKLTTKPAIVVSQPSVVVVTEKKKENSAKIAEEKPKEAIIAVNSIKKQPVHKAEKRKRTRKVRTEIIPVINATTNLNEGTNEPELDLK